MRRQKDERYSEARKQAWKLAEPLAAHLRSTLGESLSQDALRVWNAYHHMERALIGKFTGQEPYEMERKGFSEENSAS